MRPWKEEFFYRGHKRFRDPAMNMDRFCREAAFSGSSLTMVLDGSNVRDPVPGSTGSYLVKGKSR